MAASKVILFVSLVSVLYEESEGSCSSSLDCPGLQVCCNTQGGIRSSECRRSCGYVGDFCIANSDCIDSFCCNNECRGSCVGRSCYSYSETDCGDKTYCCNNICRDSCDGQSCYFDNDCGDKKYCCNDICRDSCIAHRCIFNNDCGDENEYCCNDKCQKGKCSLASWVIVMIVFSVVGGIAGIIGAAFCCYRSTNHSSPGVIVAAPLTTMPATTVVVSSNVSSYVPLPTKPAVQPGVRPHYQP